MFRRLVKFRNLDVVVVALTVGWLIFLRSFLWNPAYSSWEPLGGYGLIFVAAILLALVPMYWLGFRRSYVVGSITAAGALVFWTLLGFKFGFKLTDYITMGFIFGSLVVSLRYYIVKTKTVRGKGPMDLPLFG